MRGRGGGGVAPNRNEHQRTGRGIHILEMQPQRAPRRPSGSVELHSIHLEVLLEVLYWYRWDTLKILVKNSPWPSTFCLEKTPFCGLPTRTGDRLALLFPSNKSGTRLNLKA